MKSFALNVEEGKSCRKILLKCIKLVVHADMCLKSHKKKRKAFGPAKATDEFPTVVTVLEVLSWIVLVGGLISSVVLAGTMQTMSSYGSSYYYDYNSTSSFNFVAFIVGAVVTLIPWSFMTGLKEIVKYLHRIHSELRNLRKTEEKASGLKK